MRRGFRRVIACSRLFREDEIPRNGKGGYSKRERRVLAERQAGFASLGRGLIVHQLSLPEEARVLSPRLIYPQALFVKCSFECLKPFHRSLCRL
jgi:hypothetical protein